MAHPTGYWQSATIPIIEGRVSRATWETTLGTDIKEKRASGDSGPDAQLAKDSYHRVFHRPLMRYDLPDISALETLPGKISDGVFRLAMDSKPIMGCFVSR